MLESNFENSCRRWAQVTEIDIIDFSTIRGYMFVLTSDSFIAYEY
jgi:hypothetical protein